MTSSLMKGRPLSWEENEKDIAAHPAQGKSDAAKKGVIQAEKNKTKEDQGNEEDKEDEEEEDEDDEDE